MELQVKDPDTGALCSYTAKSDQWHGQHGFRISPPYGAGFFIAHRGGTWRVMGRSLVGLELLTNIGLALEHHPLQEQAGITDNQPSLNNVTGDEGLIDPNKP